MIRVEEVKDDAQWDARVQSVPYGTIYQTTFAAHAAQAVRKRKPHFLVALDGHRVVGQVLCLEGGVSTARLDRIPLAAALMGWISPWFSQYTFAYGPLIFDSFQTRQIVSALIDHVKKNTSFSAEHLIPPMHAPSPTQEELKDVFTQCGFHATPHGSFIVDLTPPLETLWGCLPKSSRYGVRRTEKQGVVVTPVSTREDLRDYYGIMQETFRRNGLPFLFNFEEFLESYNLYPGCHQAWLTRHEGQPVSALSLMWFNGIAFQYNVCHSDFGMEQRIYGNDLLEWHAIRTLKEGGQRLYDLAGVTLNPQTAKEKNLYHFKSRWGGRLVSAYMYSYSKSTVRRGAMSLARRILH